MTNTEMTVKDDILTIKINLKERKGKSGTGKTDKVASTEGWVKVPNAEGYIVSLNCNFKGVK